MKVSDFLKEYNVKLLKGLGQNFLTNTHIAKKIVERADINENDVVLEIGPGAGTLTEFLVLTGAKIIAVEIDKRLKPILERFNKYDNIEIIFVDFLKFDVSVLPKGFKVVANIPYSITGMILKKILFSDFSKAVLMVQKEVGDRLLLPPGADRNFLSVVVQSYTMVRKVFDVSKGNFVPRPKVDSVVLEFEKTEDFKYDIKEFWDFVSKCFGAKRKTLQNNLKRFTRIECFSKFDLKKRPQELENEEFLELFETFKGCK
ncbi:dimethyladenosine transferase [Thermosipho melanesiensis]|uniref:Ribosomal RNA small subunit methyltransferase A n=2 Tax=Thermosipho melanesiensis TaxID=46541 RepID=A6LJL0_THEM4|nr:16S rRNA (adenine(1518)-N(6)/adenine(1519)-N(6))-dimethyltransferase RsmA [Thermosipho melanesiensis]ABR30111.1 dimethyladenosine transferase [Thermosipho melanesiensis BI429]APT73308.1 16S rRNA methyltransferase [Thermosipho melanesiensis]OOC38699.1 dimethyladenosine transferase [Thermosipho melanesiensis]OOC40503.1 dimethyladenosine transferase [Thermosipho melanesiensis]OOC40768.1 dimethyladenosine transferase [Thermosipho melanesiensis]